MRVALVHNPDAGRRDHGTADLVRCFQERGHQVAAFGGSDDDIESAIRSRADVLVAAGGDRTVARAAIALRAHTLPLLPLPVGTANNIARSLGVEGSLLDIVNALDAPRAALLDVGWVSAPWEKKCFVESAGVGLLGEMLHASASWRGRVRQLLDRMLRAGQASRTARLADDLRKARPRWYDVSADGRDFSGEYLAVEAMNIRQVGPRLPLAPAADPGDGLLDLVLVREVDREGLIDAALSIRAAPADRSVRCQRVEIVWDFRRGHVDDEPWPAHRAHRMSGRVTVELGDKINVLVAKPARASRPAGFRDTASV